MSTAPLPRVSGTCTACGERATQLGVNGEGGWFHDEKACERRNSPNPLLAADAQFRRTP